MPDTIIDEIDTGAPRVEACINAVMKRYPSESKAALARYFEAVHQELGPLARDLERENASLRDQLNAARASALEEAAKSVEPSNMDTPSDWTEYAKIKAEAAETIRALAKDGGE